MRIDGGKPLNGVRQGSGRRGANGANGEFSLDGASEPAQHARAHRPAGLTSVDTLLTLQSVGGPDERGERLRHGHDVLDLLEDIKLDMLGGALPAGKLERLAQSLARRPPREAGDRVEDVLDEIELRARVELAKLGREAA